MSSNKALWIESFDKIFNEACDKGVSPDKAYYQACDRVDAAYRDRLADRIDLARLMKKEGVS